MPAQEATRKMKQMNELVFEVTQEADGGFVAEALGESIFTEASVLTVKSFTLRRKS